MKELLEQRAKLFEQARALVLKAETEKRALTGEEQTEYDARMADVQRLGETIERSRQSSEMQAQFERSIGPRETVPPQGGGRGSDLADAAMDTFLRSGSGQLSQEQRSIFAPVPGYRDGIQLTRATAPLSANYTTGQALGAATIPYGFVRNLENALLAYAGPRACATVIRTASGNPLPWPTTNDTGNVGAIVAENTQIAQSDPEMAFGSVVFGAFKYSSKLVLVPIELLQDSAFDIQSHVAKQLGVRLGRIQNTHFTTGAGTTLPKGLIAAAAAGVTSASPTAITYDELVDLEHAVDPAYRIGANWCFNDSVAAFLEKLKDSTGRPLLNDSFGSLKGNNTLGNAAEAPMRYTLKGYPVCICTAMDGLVATKKAVAFGDCSKFIIRDVLDLMLVRFSEKYMDYGQIGFTAFMRSDSNLVDAGTNPVKLITMHA